jgi:predicted peptidase
MLTGFNGIQSTLCQGFAGVNDAITQSTIADMQSDFALQTAIGNATVGITAQLTNMAAENAACCCDLKTTIANNTRDIIDSNNAGVRSILDFLTQDKIATLTAENQSLKFAASQAAQNAFITANQEAQTAELIRRLADPCPVPAYVVPNPNCCYNASVTFGNGCACI